MLSNVILCSCEARGCKNAEVQSWRSKKKIKMCRYMWVHLLRAASAGNRLSVLVLFGFAQMSLNANAEYKICQHLCNKGFLLTILLWFKISEWSQCWGMSVSLCSNIVQIRLLTWITRTDRRSVTNQSFKLMISRLYWPKLFIFRSWSGCDCEGYEYFTFIKQHISRNQQVLAWLPDNENDKMI